MQILYKQKSIVKKEVQRYLKIFICDRQKNDINNNNYDKKVSK